MSHPRATIAALGVAVVAVAAVAGFLIGRQPVSTPSEGEVAAITADLGGGDTTAATGIVVTAGGEVLTSYHAVVAAQSLTVTLPLQHVSRAGFIVGVAPSLDLAVVGLQGYTTPQPASVSGSAPAVGDTVTTVVASGSGEPVVVSASVSLVDQTVTAAASLPGQVTDLHGLIEFEASLPDAAAGAPVLDGAGNVIGFRSVGAPDVRLASLPPDAQFAIPLAGAGQALRDIENNREDPLVLSSGNAVVGLGVAQSTGASGPVVVEVDHCSPAQAAGITAGDVIVDVGGTSVLTAEDLRRLLVRHHIGDRVVIRWLTTAHQPESATVQLVSGTLS